MTDGRRRFETVCPKGHRVVPMLTEGELAAGLREGWLVFYCGTCKRIWPPTPNDQQQLGRWLDRSTRRAPDRRRRPTAVA